MICCKEAFLHILPEWVREGVNTVETDRLQELRLRLQSPPELVLCGSRQWMHQNVAPEDLTFCINAASSYSPWAASTMSLGYLTAPGGHRIGVCGEAILQKGNVSGFKHISSLCVRLAKDIPGISANVRDLKGSILILGAPGRGKTTLLRDLIRQRSRRETVSVVDERGELFPEGFDRGLQTDILTGVQKSIGIMQLLKTMGPETIAVDEITSPEDTAAILAAVGCGVSLLATVHASSLEEWKQRPISEALTRNHVFQHVLILQKDQTYQVERMES